MQPYFGCRFCGPEKIRNMENNNEQARAPQTARDISEQTQIRMQKLADLKAAGNDPYLITKFPQDAFSADLKEEFAELPPETDVGAIQNKSARIHRNLALNLSQR